MGELPRSARGQSVGLVLYGCWENLTWPCVTVRSRIFKFSMRRSLRLCVSLSQRVPSLEHRIGMFRSFMCLGFLVICLFPFYPVRHASCVSGGFRCFRDFIDLRLRCESEARFDVMEIDSLFSALCRGMGKSTLFLD